MIPDPFIRHRGGADALEEGYFLLDMHRSGRVSVPIRIWYGPPEDPEEMIDVCGPYYRLRPIAERVLLDRSPRWQIEINGVEFGDPAAPACIAGRPIDNLDEFWPRCKSHPIDEADYLYRVARALHAERYDGEDPFAGTGRKVDVLTAPLPDFS